MSSEGARLALVQFPLLWLRASGATLDDVSLDFVGQGWCANSEGDDSYAGTTTARDTSKSECFQMFEDAPTAVGMYYHTPSSRCRVLFDDHSIGAITQPTGDEGFECYTSTRPQLVGEGWCLNSQGEDQYAGITTSNTTREECIQMLQEAQRAVGMYYGKSSSRCRVLYDNSMGAIAQANGDGDYECYSRSTATMAEPKETTLDDVSLDFVGQGWCGNSEGDDGYAGTLTHRLSKSACFQMFEDAPTAVGMYYSTPLSRCKVLFDDNSIGAITQPIQNDDYECFKRSALDTTTPEAFTTALNDTTTAPEALTTEQEDSTTALEDSTTAQEDSTTTQEDSTTAPEASTTAPEDSTTALEDPTTAPEDSTTAQEDSTTALEDRTTAQEDSTTAPEDSTTPQDDSTVVQQDPFAAKGKFLGSDDEATASCSGGTKHLLVTALALAISSFQQNLWP